MANLSAIKLPNGTTYNLKDSVSGYTTNTGTITKVQTTAGAHTAINVTSGAATFNVPTKTSHLTNDSGFITDAGVTGVKGNSESSYRTGQVNLTAANIGATSTSVLPNDNGEIKTKFRISQKGYTGSGTPTWYYPLVKLPVDNSSNYASLIVSGRIGGWTNDNMSSIQALVWNRGSTGIALLDIAGGATAMSSIWGICDIVVYTNSDTTDTVYLMVKSYYTFDLDIEVYQSAATILYDETYITTTPAGTLNAQASTSTKRVEIVGGKLLVNGTDLSTTAGTGLSKSGTTLNHSNSVTAQTTQAVYPIKIDAQGHISAYGSAVTPLTSHQTIKQDGVTGATGNHFGTCSIAAGTAAKTVSITAGTPTLETGLRVTVKFSNANTANSPTLNVNSTGAKNIFHNGAQITSGSNKALLAGTVEFVYDGTQWQLVGNYVDTNTTYTIPTSAASKVTGISISDHGTTSVGSASGWSAGTASTWAFTGVTVANSISGAVDGTDSTQLNITLGTTTVQSKSSGSNSTVPSLTITSTTVVNGKSHSITDNGHTHTLS